MLDGVTRRFEILHPGLATQRRRQQDKIVQDGAICTKKGLVLFGFLHQNFAGIRGKIGPKMKLSAIPHPDFEGR